MKNYNFIHINGNAFNLPKKYIDFICSSKDLLNDIDDGLVRIDSEEKALRWCFLEKVINPLSTLVVSDIIDISNIYNKIKISQRNSKIESIIKK